MKKQCSADLAEIVRSSNIVEEEASTAANAGKIIYLSKRSPDRCPSSQRSTLIGLAATIVHRKNCIQLLDLWWFVIIQHAFHREQNSPVVKTRHNRIILDKRNLVKLVSGWDESFLVICHGCVERRRC